MQNLKGVKHINFIVSTMKKQTCFSHPSEIWPQWCHHNRKTNSWVQHKPIKNSNGSFPGFVEKCNFQVRLRLITYNAKEKNVALIERDNKRKPLLRNKPLIVFTTAPIKLWDDDMWGVTICASHNVLSCLPFSPNFAFHF